MTALVSVIIPVYNTEKYLRQCLDSVCGQTLTDIEIICVNDGSTDQSEEILQEYARRDPRIRIFLKEHSDAGSSRNLGMEHATGKYLIFWDSDDFFQPDALEKLYRRSETDEAQICICGANKYDEKTGSSFPDEMYLVRSLIPEKQPFCRDDVPGSLFNISSNVPWNKLFLRSFIEQHGLRFQSVRQANDVYFVMMALFYAERIVTLNDHLMNYRVNNDSSLSETVSQSKYCSGNAFLSVLKELEKQEGCTPLLIQSLRCKAVAPLIATLRRQRSFEDAREVFAYYKNYLFPELGLFGNPDGYFPGQLNPKRVQYVEQGEAEDFILHEARYYEQALQASKGKAARDVEKMRLRAEKAEAQSRELKKTQEKLKQTEEKLKQALEKQKKTEERLDHILQSKSYRLLRKAAKLRDKIFYPSKTK